MNPKPRRVLLGEITTVHGIKGEVVIRSHTADPEDIAAYGPLSDETGTRTFHVTSARAGPKGVVARLKGVEDRNAAERLRGTTLYVDRDALPKPEQDNEFYVTDLIGLAAIAEDGKPLGKVVAVQNFGAGDLLEVAIAEQRATELVPFTDACVPHVDLAAGTVTVRPPATLEDDPDDMPPDFDPGEQ